MTFPRFRSYGPPSIAASVAASAKCAQTPGGRHLRKLKRLIRPALLVLAGVVVGAAATLGAMAAGVLDPYSITGRFGTFPTTPKAELLDDGRRLRLLEDFVYVDPRGKAWTAEKDHVVDGASIPWPFWSLTGGPLEGKYRNASIVHDVGCDRKADSWEDVHLMFYEACRCGGVGEVEAKVLFAAVYARGPRWERRPVYATRTVRRADGTEVTETYANYVEESLPPPVGDDDRKMRRLAEYVERNNPSVEEIRRLDFGAI